MLWIKALHIIFMVTWFAGLFYLPRLYIYHVMSDDATSLERFQVMERRLFAIMTIGAVLCSIFGVWLLMAYAWSAFSGMLWLSLKLLLVMLLIGFHVYCFIILRRLKSQPKHYSDRYLRWVNEIPTVILIAVVILVVVKPL